MSRANRDQQQAVMGQASACPSQTHRLKLVPTELIRVGYVAGAHGLHGALRVRLDNPDSVLLQGVQRLTLVRSHQSIEYAVAGVQTAGHGTVKIILDGITDANQALALRGTIVMVAAAALPPTAPGEFYYFQALGCEVVTTMGLAVGTIEEVFSNGANEVWVVRGRTVEHLVPVIEDIVKSIDFAARRIIIEAVPGLLD
jgi:16S rRNA processing protein RimM